MIFLLITAKSTGLLYLQFCIFLSWKVVLFLSQITIYFCFAMIYSFYITCKVCTRQGFKQWIKNKYSYHAWLSEPLSRETHTDELSNESEESVWKREWSDMVGISTHGNPTAHLWALGGRRAMCPSDHINFSRCLAHVSGMATVIYVQVRMSCVLDSTTVL